MSAKHKKTMKVRIVLRDGWTIRTPVVEISAKCPECGGPRGTPYGWRFFETGENQYCDRWTNPCGHIDKYRDVLNECTS